MTEILPVSAKEAISKRYAELERVDTVVQTIMERGLSLNSQQYSTAEEARTAVQVFKGEISSLMNATPELSKIALTARGSGVWTPNLVAGHEEDGSGMTVQYHPEEPIAYPVDGSFVKGVLDNIYVYTTTHPDGRYSISSQLCLTRSPATVSLRGHSPLMPETQIGITTQTRVMMDGTTDVRVEEYYRARHRREAIGRRAQLGDKLLSNALTNLDRALMHENPDDYATLKSIALLRDTDTLLHNSRASRDVVAEILTGIIGEGSTLRITHRQAPEVAGQFIRIMPDDPMTDTEKMTMVMSVHKDDDTAAFECVPLQDLTEFNF